MKLPDLYAKLFVSDRFFTIAIRTRKDANILTEPSFVPDFVVPATREKWVADPILADADGKTYLFYEAVLGDKGHIEVAEVFPDGSLGTEHILLQDDCHYSYPFVFSHEGQWYMIPESSAAKEVRLYRAVSFPLQWELQEILLEEKAVDTTVFLQNGQLKLLTFFPVENSEQVIPHAYDLTLGNGNSSLTPIPWESFDSLRVRGAGPVWEESGIFYRPAQISQEQRYGDGLVFYRTEMTDACRETPCAEITGADIAAPGFRVDGLHTYCRSERFEAIDIRCAVVDYAKPLRKILSKLKR